MAAAEPISVSNAVTAMAPAPRAADTDGSDLSFGEILSDINPLQYLPVVGTIYRAVTGDTIPKGLREAGSIAVSGLIGGPVGIATSLATLGFEKLTGLDFEAIAQSVLASIGSEVAGGGATAVANSATQPAAAPPTTGLPTAAVASPGTAATSAPSVEVPSAGQAWSPAQLAAYGVVTLPGGVLQQGALRGADVLNALQLGSLQPVAAAA